ncbi:arginase [Flavobacterium wongokense]|uniref:arginase n=1 Tax=Flavobacterium wongokense TaxID=2910674 RepID=UPI001F1AA269|nr:arginase [Flavobacterium sp. WG47]MCF6132825.1 arginase [Flavobacterium sp. WG47]
MHKNIVFLINKSEITAGSRGASLGPEAIITAARRKESAIFGENQTQKIENANHLLDFPARHKFAKRIDGLITIYQEIHKKVSSLLSNDDFPILLAADHGSAGGTIAGIKSAFPDKRLGVIWIDAHADIHTPYTTPTGNMHGMPLATALNIDNLECRVNDVCEETVLLWNQLKNIGNISPKILPEDIVYIAVRDTEEQEDCIIRELGIKNYPVAELRQKGVSAVIDEISLKLNTCDIIYVSFDVDSMDPDLTSYGTGTPVKDGLSPQEAEEILVALAKNPKTVCIEVVEVNPCLDDKKNTMAEVALGLIESVVKTLK